MDCGSLIKTLQEKELDSKEIERYRLFCGLDENRLKFLYVTSESASKILNGIIGGLVFVIALVFRELILDLLNHYFPDLSTFMNLTITISLFTGIIILVVYILLRMNRRHQKIQEVLDHRSLSI